MKTNFNQTVGTGSPGKTAALIWLVLAPTPLPGRTATVAV